MEAARTLAERGHETSLYEKSDRLGGQWKLVANHLPEENHLIDYLSTGLKKSGVKVFMNQAVTARMVEEIKPDAVVVATGSIPSTLDIPGIDGRNVVQATDVLAKKVDTGQEVVVIGGRTVGTEVALFLAEQGKNVSIVTRSKIARGLDHNLKMTLLEYFIKYRVRMYPNSTPESITEKGVNCWWDAGDANTRDSVFFFLPADTIVLAVGAVNDYRLGEELSGMLPEVYKIGGLRRQAEYLCRHAPGLRDSLQNLDKTHVLIFGGTAKSRRRYFLLNGQIIWLTQAKGQNLSHF